MSRIVAAVVGAVLAGGLAFGVGAEQKSSSAAKSEAPAKAAQTVKPAAQACDTLVVVARITEIPGKFPPNDLYNYVYIMKYRVVSIVKGSYAGQELLVGIYNPLIPRNQIKDKMAALAKGDVSRFEMGAAQKLVLVKPVEKVWKDAVEDEYFDSELDKFYALRVDVAK